MIRYTIDHAGGAATVELDVDNASTPARLEVRGAGAVAVKRALMQRLGVSLAAMGAVRGDALAAWMASEALRDLAPVLTDGAELLRGEGTSSRHDCGAAAGQLGAALGGFAALPRGRAIFDDGYEWEHLSASVRSACRELAAYERHCGAEHDGALFAAIAREQGRLGPARFGGEVVVRAFKAASTAGGEEAILRAFWAALDG